MGERSPWVRSALLLSLSLLSLPLIFSARLPALIPAAAACFWVLLLATHAVRTRRLTGHTPADWPLLILLLLLPFGLVVSADTAVTLPLTYAWVAGAVLFWLLAAQYNHPWLRHSSWLLITIGLLLAAAVFVATEFPTKVPWLSWDLSAWQPNLPLQRGRFNPNLSGSLMSLLLMPMLVLMMRGNSRTQRLGAAFAAIPLGVLLLLSQSRGAMLGVLTACMVLTIIINRRWLWLWLGLGVLAVSAILLFNLHINLGTVSNDAITTLAQREELWRRGLYLIQDFPFTGVGLGMSEQVIKLLYPLFSIGPQTPWYHVHNTYLQIGCEMGIPGLIAFLALLFSLSIGLIKSIQSSSTSSFQPLSLGLLGTLIVFMTHGLVEAPLASPKTVVLFFGLMGLMAAVSRAKNNATSP